MDGGDQQSSTMSSWVIGNQQRCRISVCFSSQEADGSSCWEGCHAKPSPLNECTSKDLCFLKEFFTLFPSKLK